MRGSHIGVKWYNFKGMVLLLACVIPNSDTKD
jgi:hypothetical protein